MEYTTLYQITTVEPQAFFEVSQDFFLYDPTNLQYYSLVVFLLFMGAGILTVATVAIWSWSETLRGRRQLTQSAQLKLIIGLYPIVLLLVLFGPIMLVAYPIHNAAAKSYSNGECKTIEGVITDLHVEHYRTTQANFKINKQLISICCLGPGFHSPTDPAIRNGQKVRIWEAPGLESGYHFIVRIDVLRSPWCGGGLLR